MQHWNPRSSCCCVYRKYVFSLFFVYCFADNLNWFPAVNQISLKKKKTLHLSDSQRIKMAELFRFLSYLNCPTFHQSQYFCRVLVLKKETILHEKEFLNLSLLFDKNSFTDLYLTWHVNVTVKMQFHYSLLLLFLLLLDFYYFFIIITVV